jgi:hypothetical protein
MATLLAMVFLCALGLGWLRWQIDAYQSEWQVEQRALAEIRRAGGHFTVGTRTIGPAWLRTVAGAGRAKYFDRVDGLFFTASDAGLVGSKRESLKYLRMVFQD